jgi:hypothetical protein
LSLAGLRFGPFVSLFVLGRTMFVQLLARLDRAQTFAH